MERESCHVAEIGCLHPGFLQFDLDGAFFLMEAEGRITKVLGVNVGFQVDFGFAQTESGLAGANLAGRLKARNFFPPATDIGIAAAQYCAD